jgi:hypothetical protein
MATVECLCPPTKAGEVRHPDGETIELRERLDFDAGRTARNIIKMGKAEELTTPEIMTELSDWFLTAGIRKWSVIDEAGKPVEPNRATIAKYLFANDAAHETICDEADGLYSEAVTAPLVAAAWKPSPPTPTKPSTSQTNGSSSKPPKPSKPSSTTTSPTDATGRTSRSLDGVSSSSPSLA